MEIRSLLQHVRRTLRLFAAAAWHSSLICCEIWWESSAAQPPVQLAEPIAQSAERQKKWFSDGVRELTHQGGNSLVNTHQVGFMNAQLLFTVCSSGSSSLFRYNLTTKPPDLPGRRKAKTLSQIPQRVAIRESP
jgi:hypothetical protein